MQEFLKKNWVAIAAAVFGAAMLVNSGRKPTPPAPQTQLEKDVYEAFSSSERTKDEKRIDAECFAGINDITAFAGKLTDEQGKAIYPTGNALDRFRQACRMAVIGNDRYTTRYPKLKVVIEDHFNKAYGTDPGPLDTDKKKSAWYEAHMQMREAAAKAALRL